MPPKLDVFRAHAGSVLSVITAKDGLHFVTCGADGVARIWDWNMPSTSPEIFHSRLGQVRTVALSPDGSWLFATSVGGAETRSMSDRRTSSKWNTVPSQFISPDGRRVLTLRLDGMDYHELVRPERRVMGLLGDPLQLPQLVVAAFSSDGNLLVTSGQEGTSQLWDLRDRFPKPLSVFRQASPIRSVTFTHDSRRFLTGGEDGRVRLWQVDDPSKPPEVMAEQSGEISALVVDPAFLCLATSGESTLRLWDLSHRGQTPIALETPGFITSLAIGPDGHWLAGGTTSRDVFLMTLRLNELIPQASKVVGRNMTRQEWAQYFPGEEYRKTFVDLPAVPQNL